MLSINIHKHTIIKIIIQYTSKYESIVMHCRAHLYNIDCREHGKF